MASAFINIDEGNLITYEGNLITDPRYIYKTYKLNLDKVNSVDDCKKILKFLCEICFKPIPILCEPNGFEDIEDYFETEVLRGE